MSEAINYEFQSQLINLFTVKIKPRFDIIPHLNIFHELLGSAIEEMYTKWTVTPKESHIKVKPKNVLHGYGLFVKIMSDDPTIKHNIDRISTISEMWHEISLTDKTRLNEYAKKWVTTEELERTTFAQDIRTNATREFSRT